jgi:hypothetical protein
MPQRDWRGRSLDDPEWDGADDPAGCVALVGLVVCTSIIWLVIGILIGRWWG